MDRLQLITLTADRVGITAKTVKAVLDTVSSLTKTALAQGDAVPIHGLGSVRLHTIPGRNYKNPRTGNIHKIAPKKKIVIYAKKSLRDAVAGL